MAVEVNQGGLAFNATIDDQQFKAAISAIERQLGGLTQTANKEANAIDALVRKTVTAIGTYAAFAGAQNFVGDIVRVRGEFQQLEVAFTTMLGSKEKADKLLAEVTEFAAKTPFELKDVAGATKQLLAFGIGADSIKSTLKSLGDISAGIGAPIGEIAYLFGTIKTQGVALTQDVRQFAQRGIPIYEELAKVLRVSKEEVSDLITAGKVGFPEVEAVFKNLTAEGSKFGGLMEAQSKTLTGQISNLRDAWDQMLNTIGRSQEGTFSTIIQGAISAVENFEDIIDVIKLLVITYGSYKAAVIVTTAVQGIATAATKGYTIAELLRYRAMLLSEKAMKILNATMLSNPAVAVATGIAALVAALVIFNRRASEAKTKAELLADAETKVADGMAEMRSKIDPYLTALKSANVSEADRVRYYNEILAIDPKIVQGLDAKTLSYEKLAGNVTLYLDALRKQLQLEANKDALKGSINNEQEIQKKIDAENKSLQKSLKAYEDIQKNLSSGAGQASEGLSRSIENSRSRLEQLNKDLQTQKKISEELAAVSTPTAGDAAGGPQARTLKVINDEIDAEKKKQEQFSRSSKEYQDYQKKIIALEAERRRITGATRGEISAGNKLENEINALLEKRKDLLGQIDDQKRNADQSGMIKEQSELDKINERYDNLISNVAEYNSKVDEFNRKTPGSQVNRIGQLDLDAINAARNKELGNQRIKEQATLYEKSLEDQKRLFEKYEESKKDIGVERSNELFASQTKGYESYLKFLQAEAAKLAVKMQFGLANGLDIAKFESISNAIKEFQKEQADQELENEKEKIRNLLEYARTYNEEKAKINKKYDELETTLEKDRGKVGYEEKRQALQQFREEEIQDLNNALIRQSDLYRKLNEDIIGFTRDTIKQRIDEFKKQLKTDASLTPQQKADIERTIESYEGVLTQTNEVYKDFTKLAEKLGSISGIFDDLAGALEGVNNGLAGTLGTLSQLTSVASSAANAIASFALGPKGIISGITSTIKAIGGLFTLGKQARESRRQAEAEIEEFNNKILAGEVEITQEYRNRQREQAKLNKLKLEGLTSELVLLTQQKSTIQAQYSDILRQLQQQTFVVGQSIEKYGGFLGIGRKSRVVDVTQSLAGKSFEELEQLFNRGQLVGKAKELFELLQKLKNEGTDIDSLLAENTRSFQEALTGTTTDGIVQSIINGFAEGKRSVADFAGTFQELMQQALLQSLQLRYLEGPLSDFFQQFAALTESDGQLTNAEIANLQNQYNQIIENAAAQFDQLQQVAGVNLASQSGQGNSLQGAIKGITEDQANLLAGQFGGLRLTAIEQLNVSRQHLTAANLIQVNTANTVVQLQQVISKMVYYYETVGVKIR